MSPVRILGTVEGPLREKLDNAVVRAAQLRGMEVPTAAIIRGKQVYAYASNRDPRDVQCVNISAGAITKFDEDELTASVVRAFSSNGAARPRSSSLKSVAALVLSLYGAMFVAMPVVLGSQVPKAAFHRVVGIVAVGCGMLAGAFVLQAKSAGQQRRLEFDADAETAQVMADPDLVARMIAKSPKAPVEYLGPAKALFNPVSSIPSRAQRIEMLRQNSSAVQGLQAA